MKHFDEDSLITFFKIVDRNLSCEATLKIIGGTAAIIYKSQSQTKDIDTSNEITAEVKAAVEIANKETGFNIPVTQSSVYDGPYDWEDRTQQWNKSAFTLLKIYIPNPVDLILMKTVRGYANDIQTCKSLVSNHKIEYQSLINSFKEMKHTIGEQRKLQQNFIAVIEACYSDINIESVCTSIGFKISKV